VGNRNNLGLFFTVRSDFSDRSEAQPGRPQPRRQATKKEKLKFANDYDFEQANEQFKEFLSKFEVK
jgi:hypothetical protein